VSRGAALPATLFALAMTSAMAIGGLHVARRHAASALEMNAALGLQGSAERAALEVLVNWDSAARVDQPVGHTATLIDHAGLGLWITRIAELDFLIVAEARTASSPTFSHRVALSVVFSDGRARLPFPRAWALLP
jgi:hypothetical protein